jgi:hypothetical protein
MNNDAQVNHTLLMASRSLPRLAVADSRGASTLMTPIEREAEYFKGARLKVAVIRCGYVALPLGLRFAEAGHRVAGFDTDSETA